MNIQDEAYSEAMDEIKRLKAQHEEMLLKHAREQGAALSALEAAMEELERYKALLRRAAEALTVMGQPIEYGHKNLIAELRKAAE